MTSEQMMDEGMIGIVWERRKKSVESYAAENDQLLTRRVTANDIL